MSKGSAKVNKLHRQRRVMAELLAMPFPIVSENDFFVFSQLVKRGK